MNRIETSHNELYIKGEKSGSETITLTCNKPIEVTYEQFTNDLNGIVNVSIVDNFTTEVKFNVSYSDLYLNGETYSGVIHARLTGDVDKLDIPVVINCSDTLIYTNIERNVINLDGKSKSIQYSSTPEVNQIKVLKYYHNDVYTEADVSDRLVNQSISFDSLELSSIKYITASNGLSQITTYIADSSESVFDEIDGNRFKVFSYNGGAHEIYITSRIGNDVIPLTMDNIKVESGNAVVNKVFNAINTYTYAINVSVPKRTDSANYGYKIKESVISITQPYTNKVIKIKLFQTGANCVEIKAKYRAGNDQNILHLSGLGVFDVRVACDNKILDHTINEYSGSDNSHLRTNIPYDDKYVYIYLSMGYNYPLISFYMTEITEFAEWGGINNNSYLNVDFTNTFWDVSQWFYHCYYLKSIPDNLFINSIYNTFRFCRSLKAIPKITLTSTQVRENAFESCYGLVNMGGIYNIKSELNLEDSESLTYESLLNIIDGLGDVSDDGGENLILSELSLRKLFPDDVKKATDKGWNVVGYELRNKSKLFKIENGYGDYKGVMFWITNPSNINDLYIVDANREPIEFEIVTEYQESWSAAATYGIRYNYNGEWNVYYPHKVTYMNTTNAIDNYNNGGNIKDIISFSNSDIRGIIELDYTGWDLEAFFCYCKELSNIDALSSWDVSNVTSLKNLFKNSELINDIRPLRSWDVSNVTTLYGTFEYTSIGYSYSLSSLSSWDVSNVTTLSGTFLGCKYIEDLSPLSSWDVSNVIGMSATFAECDNLSDLSGIYNWDVSNVRYFSDVFNGTAILNADILNYWDISNAYDLNRMFENCRWIESVPFVNVRGAYSAVNMFHNCGDLKYLGGFGGLSTDFMLDTSPLLEYESVMNVVNNLKQMPDGERRVLFLHPNISHDPAIIGIANSKNWMIV